MYNTETNGIGFTPSTFKHFFSPLKKTTKKTTTTAAHVPVHQLFWCWSAIQSGVTFYNYKEIVVSRSQMRV